MLLEPGGMGDAEGLLVGACRNVDYVNQILHCLGDAHALVQVVAALDELVAAHAEFDGEPRADGVPDGGQHLAGEAHAVLKRAAVLVRAVVEQRREELVDEPAVPAVDHDHLEPGAFGEGGGAAEGLRDLVDLLNGQSLDRSAVRAGPFGGAPLGHLLLLVPVGEVRSGELAGVAELHGGNGAVALDGVGGVREARQTSGDGEIQPEGMAAVRGMHHALGDGDRRRAAVGAQLVELQGALADAAVPGDFRAAHGRGEHAVTEDSLADGDRRTQMRIFVFHVFGLSCRSRYRMVELSGIRCWYSYCLVRV